MHLKVCVSDIILSISWFPISLFSYNQFPNLAFFLSLRSSCPDPVVNILDVAQLPFPHDLWLYSLSESLSEWTLESHSKVNSFTYQLCEPPREVVLGNPLLARR